MPPAVVLQPTASPAQLQAFVADAPKLTTAVVLAIRSGDAAGLVDVAHRLDALSRSVGATAVADAAAVLERAAYAGRIVAVPDDHGLGHAMVAAVRTCREKLLVGAAQA